MVAERATPDHLQERAQYASWSLASQEIAKEAVV